MLSSDDIHGVVFDMDPSSAPGPDGFTGFFYRNCWDIVGRDVVRVVQDLFISGSLHPRVNSNLMALIPKTTNAVKVEHFRPIAMGNFVFKLITRMIVDHLSSICDKILSPNQFGFVKGRNGCECGSC